MWRVVAYNITACSTCSTSYRQVLLVQQSGHSHPWPCLAPRGFVPALQDVAEHSMAVSVSMQV